MQKQEEQVLNQARQIRRRRDAELNMKRLARMVDEAPRRKTHWDYLLAEMEWMSNDFKEERKWKMALAKKTSKAVMKYHQLQKTKMQREQKNEGVRQKKVATKIAREIKTFWGQIEKIVVYQHTLEINQEKKKALDKHLDFLVGQTERYSSMLADDMAGRGRGGSLARSARSTRGKLVIDAAEKRALLAEADQEEFSVDSASDADDDEETLADEEAQSDPTRMKRDAADLHRNGNRPIGQVLASYGLRESELYPDAPGEEANSEQTDDDNVALLLEDAGPKRTQRMKEATAAAKASQPRSVTVQDDVVTRVPFLLNATLRDYQHVALDWLTSLYDQKLNGILADEMGLGKTLMTIAMLAYLACERGIWGPHLIVVPTSVLLNWEIEFKKFCPAFKVLCYYGSQKQRKAKREGWSKPNAFHVCVTSYKLAVQDHHVFRRKKWKYLILDEAHHIKNFQSQRWQTMLKFQAKRRLLLTGTPLQNNIMELWSLLHFLMPHIFASHKEFKDWFSNPLNSLAETGHSKGSMLVKRLHGVLRPFVLRRLKCDVEKQLPSKHEHVVPCPLSKRQRELYEEFMSRSATSSVLSGGSYVGIMNCIMQLRKVCNHPDLFEPRPIVSSFDMDAICLTAPAVTARALQYQPLEEASPTLLCAVIAAEHMARWESETVQSFEVVDLDLSPEETEEDGAAGAVAKLQARRKMRAPRGREPDSAAHLAKYVNHLRCSASPMYGSDLRRCVTVLPYTSRIEGAMGEIEVQRWWQCDRVHETAASARRFFQWTHMLLQLLPTVEQRAQDQDALIQQVVFTIPSTRANGCDRRFMCGSASQSVALSADRCAARFSRAIKPISDACHRVNIRKQLYFPDKRLLQFDCGKLQVLDTLLRQLKQGDHRALIFTQMTKMLDVLEGFLNIHGYTYVRLDGSTRIDDRQRLMDRFNSNDKIFIFILSTRSGGVGVNLTGADTVIFYDSDWNPAMDAQAQDRAHRIGQTREVHIYRLISERTVEENILTKSRQKANLNDMVMSDGKFNTEQFENWNMREVKDLFVDETRKSQERLKEKEQHKKQLADERQRKEQQKAARLEAEAQRLFEKRAERSGSVRRSSSASAAGSSGAVAAATDDEPEKAGQTAEQSLEDDDNEVSTAELMRVMADVEDDDDKAAYGRIINEHEASLAEFSEREPDAEDADGTDEQAAKSQLSSTIAAGRSTAEADAEVLPSDSLEASLTHVQRYAMQFMKDVNPVVDSKLAHETLEHQEQDWELDQLQRIKEEEEDRVDEDDEILFYDVVPEGQNDHDVRIDSLRESFATARESVQQELLLYGPPTLEADIVEARRDEDGTTSTVRSTDDRRRRKNRRPRFDDDYEYDDSWQEGRQTGKGGRKHQTDLRADAKRKHERQLQQKKYSGKFVVDGDGSGLFNVAKYGKKPKARIDRRKQGDDDGVALGAQGEPWNDLQDLHLLFALSQFGENWELIAEVVSRKGNGPPRTASQCLARSRLYDESRRQALLARRDRVRESDHETAASLCSDEVYTRKFQLLSEYIQRRLSQIQFTNPATQAAAQIATPHQSHMQAVQSSGVDLAAAHPIPEAIHTPERSVRDVNQRIYLKPALKTVVTQDPSGGNVVKLVQHPGTSGASAAGNTVVVSGAQGQARSLQMINQQVAYTNPAGGGGTKRKAEGEAAAGEKRPRAQAQRGASGAAQSAQLDAAATASRAQAAAVSSAQAQKMANVAKAIQNAMAAMAQGNYDDPKGSTGAVQWYAWGLATDASNVELQTGMVEARRKQAAKVAAAQPK